MKIELFHIVYFPIKHACRIIFRNIWPEYHFNLFFFWPKSKFLLRRQMLWHQTLNQETLSLCVKYLCLKWTSQFEGIVVGIFQMCVILSCARGSIEVVFSADDVCGWNSLWRFNLLFVRSSSSDLHKCSNFAIHSSALFNNNRLHKSTFFSHTFGNMDRCTMFCRLRFNGGHHNALTSTKC